jgi:hypothetical protein
MNVPKYRVFDIITPDRIKHILICMNSYLALNMSITFQFFMYDKISSDKSLIMIEFSVSNI